MREYPFHIVNVFAESIFGGNPLCVFETGHGLTDAEMQALALQFNLSETTFILPSDQATARVRIFTPTFEMAFAGHPTLGSAHIVRKLMNTSDHVTLEMKAGVIPVSAVDSRWTLKANAPAYRPFEMSREQLADVLGLAPADIADGARWVNTGSEQLIVPLASQDAVRRAQPSGERLAAIASNIGRSMAYVFAHDGPGKLYSRFFFMKHGSVVEDPGTGSATANLGGWFAGNGTVLPVEFAIVQGEPVNRTCHLGLRVDADASIFVSGRVIELGTGVVRLP